MSIIMCFMMCHTNIILGSSCTDIILCFLYFPMFAVCFEFTVNINCSAEFSCGEHCTGNWIFCTSHKNCLNYSRYRLIISVKFLSFPPSPPPPPRSSKNKWTIQSGFILVPNAETIKTLTPGAKYDVIYDTKWVELKPFNKTGCWGGGMGWRDEWRGHWNRLPLKLCLPIGVWGRTEFVKNSVAHLTKYGPKMLRLATSLRPLECCPRAWAPDALPDFRRLSNLTKTWLQSMNTNVPENGVLTWLRLSSSDMPLSQTAN
jgi:hypothetical protein